MRKFQISSLLAIIFLFLPLHCEANAIFPFVWMLSYSAFPFYALFAIVAEGIFLRKFLSITKTRAFVVSVFVNVLSTFIGYVPVALLFPLFVLERVTALFSIDVWKSGTAGFDSKNPLFYTVFLIISISCAWGVSVIAESLSSYIFLRKHSRSAIWKTFFWANTFTYGVLCTVLVFLYFFPIFLLLVPAKAI